LVLEEAEADVALPDSLDEPTTSDALEVPEASETLSDEDINRILTSFKTDTVIGDNADIGDVPGELLLGEDARPE
jgi:hypothetical protein